MTDATDPPRNKQAIVHPLAGADLSVYARRYFAHRPYNRPPRRSRTLTALALAVRWPFSVLESLRWGRSIRRQLPTDPVFIVGHWRSGTTHLHNILSQNPQFGWASLGQTLMPGNMFGAPTRLVYKLLRRKLPKKRSFDNVRLGVDAPQEEEIGLGNLNTLSYFNCYYYPRDFQNHFRHSVLLQDISDTELKQFSAAYQSLAARLSCFHDGRRLLFKNPASTARIALLKTIFPNARFVHIVRDPYDVFASSLRRLPAMLNAFAWQTYDHLDLDDIVIDCYRELMQQYLEQAEQIPAGDLVETTYADVVAAPLDESRRIHEALNLPFDSQAESAISRYLQSLGEYRSNVHALSESQVARIESEWQFAFEHWQFEKRQSHQTSQPGS